MVRDTEKYEYCIWACGWGRVGYGGVGGTHYLGQKRSHGFDLGHSMVESKFVSGCGATVAYL